MIREAFHLLVDESGNPFIAKVDVTNLNGVSWREAKKQLRNFYLARAASLRKITEKEYFGTKVEDYQGDNYQ